MNKKPLLSLCVTTLLFLQSAASIADQLSAEEASSLRQEIITMQELFDEKGDMSMIMRKTHPAIIEMFGGQEVFERVVADAPNMLEAQGVKILDTQLGEPSEIMLTKNEEVVFLSRVQKFEMTEQNRRFQSTGFYIAVRELGSDDWLFMDSSGLEKNPELLWTLLPDLSRDVVVPQSVFKEIE